MLFLSLQVALNWVKGKASAETVIGLDIVKINKDAVSRGKTTAKQINNFRASCNGKSKYMRTSSGSRSIKNVGGRGLSGPSNGVFGIKHKKKHDIKKIVQQDYVSHSQHEANYKDLSGKKIKGALPKPKPTRCSTLLVESRKVKSVEARKQFKMRRFQDVRSRFKNGMPLSQSDEGEEEKEETEVATS